MQTPGSRRTGTASRGRAHGGALAAAVLALVGAGPALAQQHAPEAGPAAAPRGARAAPTAHRAHGLPGRSGTAATDAIRGPAKGRSAATEPSRVQRMEFEDEDVEAARAFGGGDVVTGDRRLRHKRLIVVRAHFLPELIKAAEDL